MRLRLSERRICEMGGRDAIEFRTGPAMSGVTGLVSVQQALRENLHCRCGGLASGLSSGEDL